MKKKKLFILLTALFVLSLISGANATWWDASWGYKQLITLNTDSIGMTANNTTDMPILVDINSSNTDFWSHVDSNGNDVRFTNVAETANFSYHFNDWNYAAQRARIWVKVTDTFTNGSDTTFYVYYGNPTATATANAHATYDGNFEAVYHSENPSGDMTDVTGHHAPATNNNGITGASGKIANAQQGNVAATRWYDVGWNWNGQSTFSIALWIKEVSAADGSFFGDYGGAGNRFWLYQSSDKILANFYGATSGDKYATTTTSLSTSAYSFYVLTYDGSNLKAYNNGKIEATTATTGVLGTNANYDLFRRDTAADYLGGYIDEWWFLDGRAFTENDVNLIFANQNQTAGFLSFGAEQTSITYPIDFNVFGTYATTTQLTNWNMDCNDNSYDGNFTTKQWSMVAGNYACKFSRTGYDTNGNGTTTILIEADANKTGANGYKIYLTDNTNPTLGQTGFNGFSTFTTYIKGTGNIAATASDAGSGMSYCQYRTDGGAWIAADLNTTACYKNGLTITDTTTYAFGLRGFDVAGNSDTNTIGETYTGDTNAGTTTGTFVQPANKTELDVNFVCLDVGSGCNKVTYRVDGGAWADGNGFVVYGSGTYTIEYYSTDNLGNIEATKTTTAEVTADVEAPHIIFSINKSYGFTTDYNVGYSLTCWDNRLDTLDYNVFINDTNQVFTAQDTNNVTRTSWNIIRPAAKTTFTGQCTDLSGNTITLDANTIYVMLFRLVNEETGIDLVNTDLNGMTIARVYSIDGNFKYDFNASYVTSAYFVADTANLIFDFKYAAGGGTTEITRFIDFTLLDDQNAGICVPLYQTFWLQRFTSNQPRYIILKNEVAHCYNLAASMLYVYQTGYQQATYTIIKPYYLYSWASGIKSYLGLVDGGQATEYNIDALLFARQAVNFAVGQDTIAFSPLVNPATGKADMNILQIAYKSFKGTNTKIVIEIYNGSTLLQTITDTNSPNQFYYNFNYGAYPDITDQNYLKLVLTATTPDETTSTTTYFNIAGATMAAKIDYVFAAVLSVILFIFGITITASSRTFGLWGILICLVAIALCAYSWQLWWVQLLIVVYTILLVFVVLIGKQSGTMQMW